MPSRIDETGHRYGRLVVLEQARGRRNEVSWKCRCDCGQVIVRPGNALRHGDTRSCGCLRREVTGRSRRTEGKSKVPGYTAYKSARARCENTNSQGYQGYGARGIKFRFTSFVEWQTALGPRPSPSHSVDRINNDGHYEPGNVRWATPKEQASNRRCPCPDCPKLGGHS